MHRRPGRGSVQGPRPGGDQELGLAGQHRRGQPPDQLSDLTRGALKPDPVMTCEIIFLQVYSLRLN